MPERPQREVCAPSWLSTPVLPGAPATPGILRLKESRSRRVFWGAAAMSRVTKFSETVRTLADQVKGGACRGLAREPARISPVVPLGSALDGPHRHQRRGQA